MGTELNRHVSKEAPQMAKEHMKRYSSPLVSEEMHVKTMRYHVIPLRAAIDNVHSHKGTHETEAAPMAQPTSQT